MTENKDNTFEETNVETSERYFNTKAMVLAVSTAGIGGYLIGSRRGVVKGYMQGLKDGLTQGLAEGSLEGYVHALSDVATVIRNTQQ